MRTILKKLDDFLLRMFSIRGDRELEEESKEMKKFKVLIKNKLIYV